MLHHREDCEIVATDGFKHLSDADGNTIEIFPDSTPDESIWTALALANHAFRIGRECGELHKQREIARVLGLELKPQD